MDLTEGTTVRAAERGGDWELTSDGETVGRIRGTQVELGGLRAHVHPTGQRWSLVDATGTPVLRFDPAGGKATWLTSGTGRYRLARLRWQPLRQRRVLTRGVRSEPVLTVTRGPLGLEVAVADTNGVDARELPALVAGTLVEVLGIGHAVAAA